MAEGFCSLLVIQAAGQITRYLVNRRSDSWMVRYEFSVEYLSLPKRLDWATCAIRLNYFKCCLFLTPYHGVSADQQC